MKKTASLLIAFLVSVFVPLLGLPPQAQVRPETQTQTAPQGKPNIRLSTQEQQVVDYLLDDWSKRFHSTSIPLAMSNLSMKPDDALRLRIGQYFRANTNLAKNLQWWGASNYILSNEEKRIAKYLINTYEKKDQRLPTLKEISREIGISPERLKGRLAFLAEAGLLEEFRNADPGYVLAKRYSRWGGPLRYNFHTVDVDEGKPFDVWCAVDFLLLVNSNEYSNKKIEIDDSCAHCSAPISIVIASGQIEHLDPETVWVQQGGG